VRPPAEQLAQHLAWSAQPWIGFVFAASSAQAAELRDSLPADAPALRLVAPRTPQGLRTALPELLDHPDPQRLLWVEAVHGEAPSQPPGPWTEAWDWLLLRANQRRQRLLESSAGCVFVLPMAAKPRAREAAPDLWSVRALTLELAAVEAPPIAPPTPSKGLPRWREAAEAHLVQGWASEAADAARHWLDAARALPESPEQTQQLAGAHEYLARSHRALGDHPAAMHHAEAAVEALRALPMTPADELADPTTALARCLSLHGQLLAEAGQPEAAESLHREALALRQDLAARSDDPETLAYLATSWSMLGDLAHARGDLDGAEAAFHEVLHLRRRLADDTGALRHRRLLSVALGRRGRVLCQQGRRREGCRHLREADELAQALRHLDPGNAAWHMEASVARVHLAGCLGPADRDEALALARSARAEQVALVDDEPDNARWATFLARTDAVLDRLTAPASTTGGDAS